MTRIRELSFQGQAVATERIWRWRGGERGRPSTFLGLQVQIDVLVSVFVMVSTVWSVSLFAVFFSLAVPPVPSDL